MTIWARLALALTLLADRIVDWLDERDRRREAKRQAAEVERLRNETIQWWQDNFGIDGADDRRLPDAAAEAPADAATPAARDRAD